VREVCIPVIAFIDFEKLCLGFFIPSSIIVRNSLVVRIPILLGMFRSLLLVFVRGWELGERENFRLGNIYEPRRCILGIALKVLQRNQ
jgi:hypothetical protein